MLAMQVAYRRAKESRKKKHHHSPFMSMIESMASDENRVGSMQADEELAKEIRERFTRRPPPPLDAPPPGLNEHLLSVRLQHAYLRGAWWLHQHVTSTPYFESSVVLNILAVGVTTGLSLNPANQNQPGVVTAVDVVTVVTFYVFILEAVLKIVAYGPHPLRYFTAPKGEGWFNCFDFLLVFLSVALIGQNSAGAIKTLRLARLVRLLTIVKNIPELKVIVEGLIAGLNSVGYIVILLLLVIYLFAVLGVQTFGSNDPANFGTVSIAMMSLFQASTLTAWAALAYTNWYGCDLAIYGDYNLVDPDVAGWERGTVDTFTGPLMAYECTHPQAQPVFTFLYFTSFTIVTAFMIMSLFIGVITMGMFDSYENLKLETSRKEYEEGLHEAEVALLDSNKITLAIDAAFSASPRRARTVAHDDIFHEAFRQTALACRRVEASMWFQVLVTACIMVAGVVIGFITDGVGPQNLLSAADYACLIVFTIEVFVKVLALENEPLVYFNDSWNRFDFVIVLNGWLDVVGLNLEGLTILRLLRLLRVFRLVKALPRLRSIVESLIRGFASVGWIIVLMAVFNYILACLGMLLFQELDKFHYGSVLDALFSTYQIETMDGWEMIYRQQMFGCANWESQTFAKPKGPKEDKYACNPDPEGLGYVAAIYFIFVVVFGGLILPTMLIGIVAISFEESFRRSEVDSDNAAESARLIADAQNDMPEFFTPIRIELLENAFALVDVDHGGTLDLNEVTLLINYIAAHHLRMDIDSHEVEALVFFFDEDDSGDLNFGELVTIVRYLFKARRAGLLTANDLPAEAVEKERARQHSVSNSNGLRSIEIHGREYVFGPSFDDEERAPTPSPSGARGTLGGLVAPGSAFSFLPANKVTPLPQSTAVEAAKKPPQPYPEEKKVAKTAAPAGMAPTADYTKSQVTRGESMAQPPNAKRLKDQYSGVAVDSKPGQEQPSALSATELESRTSALIDEAAGLRAMIAEAHNMQKWAKEKRLASGSGHEHHHSDEESLLHVVADFGHSLGHLAAVGATSMAGSIAHAAHSHIHLPGHHHHPHAPRSPTTHHNQKDSPGERNENNHSPKEYTDSSHIPKVNTAANQLAPKNSLTVPQQLEPLKQYPLLLPKGELKEVPVSTIVPAPGVSFPRRAAFSSEQSSSAVQKSPGPSKTKGFPLQKKNPSKVVPLKSFRLSEVENLARSVSDGTESSSIDSKAFIVPAGIDSAVL